MEVPFNDLSRQHENLIKEIFHEWSYSIANSDFILGDAVEKFEIDFAHQNEANFCLSCANGTDALYIAMKALGLKQGQEVLVPAVSWIATSETVTAAGGKVVFCDVDESTMTIDISDARLKISSDTVGIIPVHLYGNPADMISIKKIADENNLWIIEDCAQAHFAKIGKKFVGSFGDFATYSFYPGKNLGAMGDAGAITSSYSKLIKRARCFARHGGLKKHEHLVEGMNSRMDTLQAKVLNIKLRYIKEYTSRRRNIAQKYLDNIVNPNVILPKSLKNNKHVYHLFVIMVKEREKLIELFKQKDIGFNINYPKSLPFLEAYKYLKHDTDSFPIAARIQNEILSIPLFPEMREEELNYVIDVINQFSP